MRARGGGVVVDELERIARDDARLRGCTLNGELLLEERSHLRAVVQLVVECNRHARTHVLCGEREVRLDDVVRVVCACMRTCTLFKRAVAACLQRIECELNEMKCDMNTTLA